MQKIIYADQCNKIVEDKIKTELNLDIITRLPDDKWSIQDSAKIVTNPGIILAVFSTLDEIALLEIGLFLFLCKPVLIGNKSIQEYPLLAKQVDFIDVNCNLKEIHNSFISWFNYAERTWGN